MNKKALILTVVYCIGLGAVMIAAAVLSGGQHLSIIIPVASGMMLAGPAMVVGYRSNVMRMNRDCDERETQITEKSMAFTFYFMTFVLAAYWAYDVAGAGTMLRWSSLLVGLLFAAFAGAYVVNRLRY